MRSVHNPGKEGYRYDVIHPVTGKPCTEPMMGYRFPKTTLDELIANTRIIFGNDESKLICQVPCDCSLFFERAPAWLSATSSGLAPARDGLRLAAE